MTITGVDDIQDTCSAQWQEWAPKIFAYCKKEKKLAIQKQLLLLAEDDIDDSKSCME